MSPIPQTEDAGVAPNHAALQHRPRPLPLFLDMLRSETAARPDRRAAALAGLRAYQQADRDPPPPPPPVAARVGRAALRDLGSGGGRPIVMVPSLINPPTVLDLAPGNSLAGWLAGQGFRPLLVDWGNPTAADRDLSIAGHVEQLLVPLIDALDEPPLLLGYCVGGTMALAAAALRPPKALVLLATPWHFSGFPQQARDALIALGDAADPLAEELGLYPVEILQTAFWRLDPGRTIGKFERFGRLDPAGEAARGFVRLEDWANDGPPLTLAAGRELIDVLFGSDLTGRGEWRVGGHAIDPHALPCPVLDVVSTTDRIVPAASAAGVGDRLTLALGHVGMVVGGRAPQVLWQPLADWLSARGTT